MSTLTLLIEKPGLGADINFAVVARVQGIPGEANQEEGFFYREVVIPASRGAGVDLDVPPGRYRVQAILPSGEILQQERRVADQERMSVVFQSPSDDGWLSWQRYDGASAAKSVRPSTEPASPPRSVPPTGFARFRARILDLFRPRGESSTQPPEAFPDVWRGASSAPRLSIVVQSSSTSGDDLWARAAAASEALDFVLDWLPDQGNGPVHLQAKRHEEKLFLWQVEGVRFPSIWGGNQDPVRRYWAVSDVADTVEVQSLPLPWQNAEEAPPLEILVNAADLETGSRTSTIVRDPALGGLLAYLGRGRLANARPLVDSLDQAGLIERAISAKRQNPLAACAAAYVGLAIFEPEERERWDSWLPNLMDWFPWLPDGAIVHARRTIQRPRHAKELDDALQALKRAYRSGIPYFTAGTLHLRDSLVLFAKKDQEACEMLENVSRVATRLDPGQAFTLLRFPKV